MEFKLRAVLYGFLATVVVGVLGGAGIPFTDATLPIVGSGLTGVIGGAVAGYTGGPDLGDGALNGGVATILGAIVAVLVLAVAGIFVNPLAGASVLLFGLLYLTVAAIPGIVGGLVGAWLNGRTGPPAVEQPTGR